MESLNFILSDTSDLVKKFTNVFYQVFIGFMSQVAYTVEYSTISLSTKITLNSLIILLMITQIFSIKII